jgi:hypothetical protein
MEVMADSHGDGRRMARRAAGRCLGSATTRRVFGMLLAAAVPLVLFGALGAGALSDLVAEQAQAADLAALQQAGQR